MPTQTYEITAPNGKVLEITGDHVPSESELHDIFAKAGVETGAAPSGERRSSAPGQVYSDRHPLSDAPAEPSLLDRLNAMLEGPAHPQSVGDFLSLLVPSPTGSVLKPMQETAKIGGQVLRDAVLGSESMTKIPMTVLKKLVQRAFPIAEEARPVERPIVPPAPVAAAPPPIAAPAPMPTPTAPTPAAAAPAASTAAPAPAPRATARPPVPDPNPVIQKIVDAMKAEGLSDSEAQQAYRWVSQGVDPKVVWKRIQDARALQKTGPFAKLPTNAETEAAVRERNAKGRWPED